MKSVKRLLSLVLAMVMLVSMIAGTGIIVSAANSGKCGDNVTWSLYKGVLSISGSGDMYNYGDPEQDGIEVAPPWYGYELDVTKIVIGDDVTCIGDFAFGVMPNVTEVVIGDSVDTIGAYSFPSFYSLTELVVPEGVTVIGEGAFNYATSLASVTFPSTLEQIFDGAFQGCYVLESVDLSKSEGLATIGTRAFSSCIDLATAKLPDNVTYMGDYVFHKETYYQPVEVTCTLGSKTAELILSGSQCGSLSGVKGSGTCGEDLGWYLTDNGNLYIYGPGDMYDYDDIEVDKNNVAPWYNLYRESINNVFIGNDVTYIGTFSFFDIPNLATVNLGSSVETIGEYAFALTALSDVIIPDSVLNIEHGVFYNCLDLKYVHLSNSVEYIGERVFSISDISLIDILNPNVVIRCPLASYANEYAYSNNIPYEIVFSGVDAEGHFGNLYWTLDNTGLLTISGTGKMEDYSIGLSPLYSYRGSIKEVIINNGVTSVGNYFFADFMVLENVVVPSSVTSIGNGAFYNCLKIESINIPSNVIEIGNDAFYLCGSLKSIVVAADNDNYISVDGVLYTKDMSTLVKYPGAINNSAFSVPNAVEIIENDAFYAAKYLTEVTLGENVEVIGKYAFHDCKELINISLSDSLITISSGAFYDCAKLTGVTIPDSVVTIGANAFTYCESLRTAIIGDGVTSIGKNAFGYCMTLNKLVLGNGLITIGNYAFYCCESLQTVTIPASVTNIGSCAFGGSDTEYYCRSLKSIDVEEGNVNYRSVDGVLFTKDMTTLIAYPAAKIDESYTVPEEVKIIPDYAFFGALLTSIELINVETIGEYAFGMFKTAFEIVIPECTKQIEYTAFLNYVKPTIHCVFGSYAYRYARENKISYECYEDITTDDYSVMIPGAEDISYIRYAYGEHECASSIKNAPDCYGMSASKIANYVVDGVFTYEMPKGGTYSFWIKYTDGTEYIEIVDVVNMRPYITIEGMNITIYNLYGVKDIFIAKGTFDSYSELKPHYIFNVTSDKIGDAKTFTYSLKADGSYTVLIRYEDSTKDIIQHIVADVLNPTYAVNGLQINVGNLEGVKAIRTAYGEYSTVSEIKQAAGYRSFTQSVIKGSDEYTIQYRESGVVTVAVQYTNGYTDIVQLEVTQKESTMVQEGNTVTFGNLEGLQVLRYAEGEYNTAVDIKNAYGVRAHNADKIDENGNITISLKTKGIYTFYLQYFDGSTNFYLITVE